MKRILVYCRESRDDNFANFERIETQAKMLTDYIEKENLGEIIDVIIDDNKTGTDFKRLEPIKEMIINKKFDIFLCKDCSRIGRNLLESLKFIEFLEYHKIELLFLNEDYDEDIFPIKAWFNQLRVKDDSKKIKNVLKQKMNDGTLLIKAPFGYDKIGNNLVINKETSKVVKTIFNMFSQGYTKSQIKDYLNSQNIKTPSMYKTEYKNKSLYWNTLQIDRILKNEMYTGNMTYNKKQKTSYKSKKYINNDKSDWIVIKNHHEKIINTSLFLRVNNIINNKSVNIKNPKNNIYSGLIYCGDCNSIMYRKTRGTYPPYFVCKNYNKYGNKICSSKKILEDDLNTYVFNYLHELLKNEVIVKSLLNKLNNVSIGGEKINELKKQISQNKNKLSILYDDRLNNKVPDYLFNEKLNSLLETIKKLEEELSFLSNSINKQYSITDINKLSENITLSHELLCSLFQKIYIFESDENKVMFI